MKLIAILKKFTQKTFPKESLVYRFLGTLRRRPLPEFYESGFHGDSYLISLAETLLNHVTQFIETGASTGSTLVYVAKKFPSLQMWSCEPDKNAHAFVKKKVSNFLNVHLSRKTSPEFLFDIAKNNPEIITKDTLFWLDAHANGYSWPLKKEVEFITSQFKKSYILIDDFLVPNRPWFGYDSYDNQTCSMDFIQDSLNKKHSYTVYYPTYRDQTSPYCKLRGWILIEFGHEEPLSLPSYLTNKIEKIQHEN